MILEKYTQVRHAFIDFGRDYAIELMKEELGIDCKQFAAGARTFFMCNYSQIDSPKSHPLVMQCRSLIVDEFGDIVSAKYPRFFNVGECPHIVGQIDFSDSTIYDKEDGSLVGIWNNPGLNRWDISTRSMPYADGPFEMPDGTFISFRAMIQSTMLGVDPSTPADELEQAFQERMKKIENDINFGGRYSLSDTFVFEWCHPMNRIVTPYDVPKMFFVTQTSNDQNLGFANGSTEAPVEWSDRVCKMFAGRFENIYRIGYINSNGMTTAEIEERVSSLPDLKEGYVIQCNKTGIRAKMKSKTYVTAHRIRGEFKIPRDKDLCALLKDNETDEFIAYFPEWKERIEVMEDVMTDYTAHLCEVYLNADRPDQKTFALSLQKLVKDGTIGSIGMGVLFTVHRGRAIDNVIQEMTENRFFDFYEEAKRLKG